MPSRIASSSNDRTIVQSAGPTVVTQYGHLVVVHRSTIVNSTAPRLPAFGPGGGALPAFGGNRPVDPDNIARCRSLSQMQSVERNRR